MNSIWVFLIVGIVFGGLLSVVFDLYSKKTKLHYSRQLFGMDSSQLITDAIILIVAASFLFLATVSFLIKDLAYPTKKPINFTIETLLMAFLPGSIIFAMTFLRGYKISGKTFFEFGLLSAKFGILHILLQFSGFYSYFFPPL